ncbi:MULTISPECIES: hypothetical protein [unclassified Streptomyces]|uniref:hypothetical protein n=1 Tax=unclassified Streptomyces TaxID=2593676 RepID=UPI003803C4C3
MITSRIRRRAAVLALSLGPALLLFSASPSASAVGEPTLVDFCPPADDPVFAAADRRLSAGRITPAPSWRTGCERLLARPGAPIWARPAAGEGTGRR